MEQRTIYHNRQIFFDFQCSENFNAMPNVTGGKYCSQCNKNTVDFTNFTGHEIFAYIKNKPPGSVCGYVKPGQVQVDVVIQFEEAYDQLSFTKQFFFVLLFVFGASLFSIQSAQAQNKTTTKTVQTVKGNNKSTEVAAHELIQEGFEKFSTTVSKIIPKPVVEEWNPPIMGGYMVADPPQMQVDEPEPPIPAEIVYAESMPQFNGGGWQLNQYLAQSIHYPQYALENKIQGKVYVEFIVEADGKVTTPKVLKTPDESLSVEAIRVLLAMPRWQPATYKGRNVASRYVLPVSFKLQSE
jgi:TonB family protein